MNNLISVHHDPHRGMQWIYKFSNGYGASVICGPYTYGGEEGLFEIAVLKFDGDKFSICYDTEITNKVIGHLDFGEVQGYLREIKNLS